MSHADENVSFELDVACLIWRQTGEAGLLGPRLRLSLNCGSALDRLSDSTVHFLGTAGPQTLWRRPASSVRPAEAARHNRYPLTKTH